MQLQPHSDCGWLFNHQASWNAVLWLVRIDHLHPSQFWPQASQYANVGNRILITTSILFHVRKVKPIFLHFEHDWWSNLRTGSGNTLKVDDLMPSKLWLNLCSQCRQYKNHWKCITWYNMQWKCCRHNQHFSHISGLIWCQCLQIVSQTWSIVYRPLNAIIPYFIYV